MLIYAPTPHPPPSTSPILQQIAISDDDLCPTTTKQPSSPAHHTFICSRYSTATLESTLYAGDDGIAQSPPATLEISQFRQNWKSPTFSGRVLCVALSDNPTLISCKVATPLFLPENTDYDGTDLDVEYIDLEEIDLEGIDLTPRPIDNPPPMPLCTCIVRTPPTPMMTFLNQISRNFQELGLLRTFQHLRSPNQIPVSPIWYI
jgi:hypothetical protein